VTITQTDGRRILQLHFKKQLPQPAEAEERAATGDHRSE
jgi:hypothetical protein